VQLKIERVRREHGIPRVGWQSWSHGRIGSGSRRQAGPGNALDQLRDHGPKRGDEMHMRMDRF
jgi:hypothetical protein